MKKANQVVLLGKYLSIPSDDLDMEDEDPNV